MISNIENFDINDNKSDTVTLNAVIAAAGVGDAVADQAYIDKVSSFLGKRKTNKIGDVNQYDSDRKE